MKADILHTKDILGPNLGFLKRKTTTKSPSCVLMNTSDYLPEDLIRRHRNVTMTVDIMYINEQSHLL